MAWARKGSAWTAWTPVRLDYQTRTSDYTITATTMGGAAELFTDLSFTADGVSTYTVELLPGIVIYGGTAGYNYYVALAKGDGTALVGTHETLGVSATSLGVHKYFYTPAAGTQTLNARAYKEAGAADGNIRIGADARRIGGVAYIAVYRGGI